MSGVCIVAPRRTFDFSNRQVGRNCRIRKDLMERSPLAKAAASLPVVVDHTTRGFKSLPSPPISQTALERIARLLLRQTTMLVHSSMIRGARKRRGV
jgi:hypothetical protein